MPDAPGFDPPLTPEEEAALAEDIELDPELRRRVLVTHRSLERQNHYTVLGVDRSADNKAIKRAYYGLAAKFHPDKYFRKNLGSFKVRMEAVFKRITLAHDVLTRSGGRAEYDAYLEEQRRSRSIEELLADALAEAKRAEETVERQAREQEALPGGARPSWPQMPPPTPISSAPRVAPRVTPSAPTPSVDTAARRDALARRLLGGRAPSSSSAPSHARVSSIPATSSTADAVEALKRRYEERLSQAKRAQAQKYVASGETALAAGDPISAANAFRVAMTLTPDDAELLRRAGEVQAKADVLLGETYVRQAQYEEKNGQWNEAAASWTRVAKARSSDAHAHERAANAIVKAGGDLHQAGRFAKQACALQPESAAIRVTLASVYLAAALSHSARRELETATKLAPPDDDTLRGAIRAMLDKLGNSG